MLAPCAASVAGPMFGSARPIAAPPPAGALRRSSSVAVLGAGHGGMALAADLARHGHHVALWNRSPGRVASVRACGTIHLALPGAATVDARIAVATSSMDRALVDADVVLVAVPASGHFDVANAAAPHLRDGQTVLLLPGRTGGALEFRRTLAAAGCRAEVLLGEANTFPIAARTTGPASAVVFGHKAELLAAALPARRNGELLTACRPILPALVPCRSVLHTGFANVGAILHPAITLGNAERIRAGAPFDFYCEGVTPAVAALLAAADAERLRIARAYGATVDSLTAWIGTAYGHHADTVLDAVGGNPAYAGIKAPTTLLHRYLLEDVPTGLIPLLELGRAAGLRLPTLSGLVDAARRTLGAVRWQRPRTLAALGLAGMAPDAIGTFVRSTDQQRASRISGKLNTPLAFAGGPLQKVIA